MLSSFYKIEVANIRVLVLTTTFPRWKDDATPAFVYELSKRLQENGLEIVILAPHHYGAKKFEIIDGMKIYRFPYFLPAKYQKLAYEGGILPKLKSSNLAKIQVPLLLLSELLYAIKIIKKEKIDVIHSHWIIPSGLVGSFLFILLRKKHFLTIHAAGLLALKKLPFKKRIANFIIKRCDRITVVSNYISNELVDLIKPNLIDDVKQKIEIIPMGVDTTIYKSNKNKNELKIKYNMELKKVLLFIGRLAEKKGLIYLIKAMPEIISDVPNTKLLICGEGPLRNELEKLVLELNLKNNVVFEGFITNEKKIDLLLIADILMIPSIVTKSGDTEGLPVVIMEGLAAGKPIIACDVGGVNDAIKDGYNGFLIEQERPDQITAKALMILKNTNLNTEMVKNIEKSSYRYDWDTIAKQYRDIFNKIGITKCD